VHTVLPYKMPPEYDMGICGATSSSNGGARQNLCRHRTRVGVATCAAIFSWKAKAGKVRAYGFCGGILSRL